MIRSSSAASGSRLRRALVRTAVALTAGLVMTLLISGFGSLIGPAWHPRPFDIPVVPESADTTIGGDVTTVPVGTYDVETTITQWELAPGVDVTVRIRTPLGTDGPCPAVVFLHGAGTADYLGFAPQADALASAGVVTVVPDKRMDTYTVQHRHYVAFAEDYLVSVRHTQELPQVDPDRVGVYGESEGAYIAPILAASHPDDVDFLVLASSPVVPGREQASYAVHTYLAATGVPDIVFRLIPRALGGPMPFGWIEYADFDVQPYQQRLTQPVLVVYGTADRAMPLAQGALQILSDAAVAGNDAVTVRYYEGANHGLKIGGGDGALAPGVADDLARWVTGLPATAATAPQIAGAAPEQPIWADRPEPPPPPLAGTWLVATHAIFPLLVLVGGVSGTYAGARAFIRRRRGTLAEPALTQLPVLLAAAAVLAIAAWRDWILYVLNVARLATSYQQDPEVTFGSFDAQHQVALTAGFMIGVALFHWWRRARLGVRMSRVGRLAAVTTALGTVGLLVLASYWSGFPTFGLGT